MRHFFALLLIVLASAAVADTVDFRRQVVVITGVDAGPVSIQGTTNMSLRAVNVLKAASYDRDWTVAAFLSSHPAAQRKLDRMSLDSRRAGTRFLSDGAVSADFEFPLTGAIMNLLLPITGGGRLLGKTACPCCGQPWPEDKEPPPGVKLVPFDNGNGQTYTGILVDVRGLGFSPALFPRAVTSENDVVIGPEFASAADLAQSGAFGYYQDRSEALSTERIGANPLVVRALSITGRNSCDIVVSQYDAARIHGSKATLDLLARCRVGLLVD